MIDFGFDKLALIGAVALIVIGPEKLPRVARTVGTCSARRSATSPTSRPRSTARSSSKS